MFRSIKGFLTDKFTFVIAGVISIVFLFYIFSCEPTTRSMLDPTRKVTRLELTSEAELLMAKFQVKVNELDRQSDLRNFILQQTLVVAQSGTINPIGIVTGLLAIMGIGATADDIRLRRQRKNQITYEPIKTE